MIKILIAEDQDIISQSLEIILGNKPDLKVVGVAEDGEKAVRLAQKLIPDIILMDIRMPGIDGVKCIKIIKKVLPQIKIIVLTTFDDNEYVFNALKYGASGYLLKGLSSIELVGAIRTVFNGGALINPNIAMKVVEFFHEADKVDYKIDVDESEFNNLNKNELKIMKLIGRGMSNKEIAFETNFSEGTVRNYISNILSKLNLRDRTQIAIFAIQSRLELKKIEN
ncbi:response regulator transcription factor [Clostridium estertheticum]|uniref:response regulator transcription factor n=1 Tax=Clostridium estertheticum TaxID=238834 RepID=UPI001C0CC831|nr:response regulator transcription factor [Clostridium estertheticum]MBU3072080.1 response regulator transcription factor [Clostridium estertheticum]MBU3162172.1 response regulator transcription factor [Clostridium estertheticum]